MEFKEIDILLQMEALKCEREGMVAENLQRVHLEQAMAYQYDSFMVLAGQFSSIIKEKVQKIKALAKKDFTTDQIAEILDLWEKWEKNK